MGVLGNTSSAPRSRWPDLAPGSTVAQRHKERVELIAEHRTEPDDDAVLDTDGISDRVYLQAHGYAQSFKLDRGRATTPITSLAMKDGRVVAVQAT